MLLMRKCELMILVRLVPEEDYYVRNLSNL